MRNRRSKHCGLALGVLALCVTLPASANTAATARVSVAIAMLAADAWADDARLVWVENDSELDRAGRAKAWGFLYYSPSMRAMRSYSVRDGKIEHAEDHSVTVEAPAVHQQWKDSSEVIAEAWRQVSDGSDSCVLESLLLASGIFDDGVAWVAVFSHGKGPKLHIVLNARTGKYVRRWRG